MSLLTDIRTLYQARGTAAYFGERVSMTEHGLQAAHFAQLQQASERLIVAALLHDIGHLLEEVPELLEDWTADAHHEEIGARWLLTRFGPEVAEPVRLHVPAKRYLCATDSRYLGQLSSASVHTLKLQGGLMSKEEVAQFESERFAQDAVRLRHWDDQGKVAGLKTADLAGFAPMIERVALQR